MSRRSFLLQNARSFPWKQTQGHYDDEKQMTRLWLWNRLVPLAALETAYTGSKTEQAPGDDDPDPDGIECY